MHNIILSWFDPLLFSFFSQIIQNNLHKYGNMGYDSSRKSKTNLGVKQMVKVIFFGALVLWSLSLGSLAAWGIVYDNEVDDMNIRPDGCVEFYDDNGNYLNNCPEGNE